MQFESGRLRGKEKAEDAAERNEEKEEEEEVRGKTRRWRPTFPMQSFSSDFSLSLCIFVSFFFFLIPYPKKKKKYLLSFIRSNVSFVRTKIFISHVVNSTIRLIESILIGSIFKFKR